VNLEKATSRILEIAKGPNPGKRFLSRILWSSGMCYLFKFEVDGVRYRFFPSSMSAEMWSGRKYLTDEVAISKRLLERVNRNGCLVVDVGANIGVFCLTLATNCGSSRYLAIEAHPQTFSFLERNIQKNQLPIRALNLAIGSEELEVEITSKHADDMNQVREVKSRQSATIKMTTLDSLIKEEIELLKIDVEGMEKSVLLGASNVLGKTKHAIVEVDSINYDQYGFKTDEVLEILEEFGFDFVGIHKTPNNELEFTYPLKLTKCRGENVLATRMRKDEILEFINHFK
jgi:FkbM family methyltransferase